VSQIRRDALSDSWVICAPQRDARPEEFVEAQLPGPPVLICPFCGGNESATPEATLVIGDPEANDEVTWAVRVVPNRYPAVTDGDRRLEEGTGASRPSHPDLFQVSPLSGGHEVIIESPLHVQSLTDLSERHAAMVFDAYARRLRYWYGQSGIDYVVVFKNVGAAAGASLRHTHSQLVASSMLPPRVAELSQRVKAHYEREKKCLLCQMLADELGEESRIVARTPRFVAYCPFASRLPYLMRVVPLEHQESFESLETAAIGELAALTRRLLRLLESMHSPAAYNYVIQTRPHRTACSNSFHWWLEIFPRLTKTAGFEWGSDCYINPVLPETAAGHLRILSRRIAPRGDRGVQVDFSG
jgi:UDPglucose--hexose-1-phosphate uridylyltransferase